MTKERPTETVAARGPGSSRVIRRVWWGAAGAFRAALAPALCLAAVVALLAVILFSAGCAFTERIVDRKLLSSPEMRFDYLDPDRDVDDIVGILAGGGGGGGGGC